MSREIIVLVSSAGHIKPYDTLVPPVKTGNKNMFKQFASTAFLEEIPSTENTNGPASTDSYFYFAKANTLKQTHLYFMLNAKCRLLWN